MNNKNFKIWFIKIFSNNHEINLLKNVSNINTKVFEEYYIKYYVSTIIYFTIENNIVKNNHFWT